MQWLEHLGIPFEAKDIEADEEAFKEYKTKVEEGFSGVPVTDIAGDIVKGFDRPKIQAAIAAHNITPVAA